MDVAMQKWEYLTVEAVFVPVSENALIFSVPQKLLDVNKLLFLPVVVPIMGWIWIQAYVDASWGN
jgi:hypothetical protein